MALQRSGDVLHDRQHAELSLRFAKNAGLTLTVQMTSPGVLSVAALVSAILLSTALVIRAGGQAARASGDAG